MEKICIICLKQITSLNDIYIKNNDIFHTNCYNNTVINKALTLANKIKLMDTIDIIDNLFISDKLNIFNISNTDKLIIKNYYEETKTLSLKDLNTGSLKSETFECIVNQILLRSLENNSTLKSNIDTESEPDTNTESEPDTNSDSSFDPDIDLESDSESNSESELKSKLASELQPKLQSELVLINKMNPTIEGDQELIHTNNKHVYKSNILLIKKPNYYKKK